MSVQRMPLVAVVALALGRSVMPGRMARRVVAPTVGAAVVGSLLAVGVNLATGWKTNLLAWLVVAGLTVLAAMVSLWLEHCRAASESLDDVGGGQSVERSNIGGDNIQIGRARDVNLKRRSGREK